MPRLFFVTPVLGLPSEIWLDRQLERFSHIDPEVLLWRDERESRTAPYPVHELPEPRPGFEADGLRRWLFRARNMASGNYFGAPAQVQDWHRRLMEKRRPDVMLCHFGQTALYMLPVAETEGVPLVAHFHGADLSSRLRNRWYLKSLKASLRRFAAIVVVGTRQRDWLLEEADVAPERVHVISCGVPLRDFSRSRPLPPSDIPRFATVSRLVPQKGVDISLRAFAELRARTGAGHLTIVGDGPERPALEALAQQSGVAEAVRFTGAVPPEAVRAVLEETDVFLQHSLDMASGWYEGFGVSVTEAAAMEIPLVVSRCGGLLDQVEDGVSGFTVAQRDMQGMAGAMETLAADPALRRTMGRAAREMAITRFDTDGQVRKLEDLLLSVCSAR
jgi:glycosyltransferase involved in cell wall biosynthesis